MKNKKPIINTKHLTIRLLKESDREDMIDIFMDDRVKATYMIPDFETRDEARMLFDRVYALSSIEEHFEYCVIYKGKLIGFINDCNLKEEYTEVGYAFRPEYWGRGFATETLKAAIEELFRIGVRVVAAGYFEENEASHRVMLKAGMHDVDKTEIVDYRGSNRKCLFCEIEKNI